MKDLQDEILNQKQITIHTYENNTVDNIPELLKKIGEITKTSQNSTIQLLNTNHICGIKHLSQAIAEAINAFENNQNFAKDPGVEICVRASAQKQITEAIKILGIKNRGNITAIYINTTKDQIKQVEKLLNTRNDKLIEKYDEKTIRKVYNIPKTENLEDYLNEKIAMLVLKN